MDAGGGALIFQSTPVRQQHVSAILLAGWQLVAFSTFAWSENGDRAGESVREMLTSRTR